MNYYAGIVELNRKIYDLQLALAELLQVQDGVPMTGIEANARAERARALLPTPKKRSVGDIWLDIDGKWYGMSPDGVSGPWVTSRAAQHAANGEFRAANATNFRRN
jgi:hypothetical protein